MKKQMQNRMRARLTGVCLLGLCLSGGAATDGYYWPDWIYDLNPWGTIRYWEGDRVPGEGGVAYFTGKMAGNITFTSDVKLNGLDFGLVQLSTTGEGKDLPTVRANGGSLTLTGDRTFLNADGNAGASAGARGPILDLSVSGTGQNVFTKHGGALVQVNHPFSKFATVAVGGGELVTTGASGRLFASGDSTTLAVRGGTATWAPSGTGAVADGQAVFLDDVCLCRRIDGGKRRRAGRRSPKRFETSRSESCRKVSPRLAPRTTGARGRRSCANRRRTSFRGQARQYARPARPQDAASARRLQGTPRRRATRSSACRERLAQSPLMFSLLMPPAVPFRNTGNDSLARSRFLQHRVPFLLYTCARLFHVKAKARDVFPLADGTTDQLLELCPNRVHFLDIVWMAPLVELVDFKILDHAFAVFDQAYVGVPLVVFFAPRPSAFRCWLCRFHCGYLTIYPFDGVKICVPRFFIGRSDIPHRTNQVPVEHMTGFTNGCISARRAQALNGNSFQRISPVCK